MPTPRSLTTAGEFCAFRARDLSSGNLLCQFRWTGSKVQSVLNGLVQGLVDFSMGIVDHSYLVWRNADQFWLEKPRNPIIVQLINRILHHLRVLSQVRLCGSFGDGNHLRAPQDPAQRELCC